MGHAHAHAHGPGHHHHHHGASAANRRRLTFVLVLAATYMVAEFVGGIMANSLALLADAGHMLSDVGALALSLFALRIAQRPASPTRTYGLHRAEILAALANGATLAALSFYIVYEAVQRLGAPQEVGGRTVMVIATGGLIVNLVGLRVLHGGRDENLNIRGAWLHMLSDALGSVGAITSGVLVWTMGWMWADAAVSILISALVLFSAWHLLRAAVEVLLEAVPAHIDVEEVRAAMAEVPGVEEVHDLHVWTITTGMDALSGHAVVGDRTERRPTGEILADIHRVLRERFNLRHATIQIEPRGFEEEPCTPLSGGRGC
jgi:cobalt-zinc-cadmium efflux system protein